MKIIYFDFIYHFGGAPQLAIDTAKRLSVENEVLVIDPYGVCKEYLQALDDANIKYNILVPDSRKGYIGYHNSRILRLWRIICQVPIFWRLRKQLIKKIREFNPDVIWTNSELSLVFLASSFSLLSYPVVLYSCGCADAAKYRKWHRWAIKSRPRYIMTSSTETSRQLQLIGVNPENIRVVYETIDFSDVLQKSTEPLQSPLPAMDGYPRILVPATLLFTKGQHTAIKAVSRLKEKGFNPTLWLAGDVPGNDKSYLYYIEDMIRQLKVSENVFLLGWRNDVPAIISKSDIIVLPTHTEGFGRVTLEAMLLNRPAVTTPAGGMKDSIIDGYDGLFFPIDDDQSLAQCLIRLTTNKEYANMLVKNGYKTATEKFNPNKHTERVLEVFNAAINVKSC